MHTAQEGKMHHENVWIRLAGNGSRIKQGDKERWRFVIGRQAPEVQITDWYVAGMVSSANYLPGTDPAGKEFGFVAWIDMYGDVIVREGVAYVALKEPPTGQ